MRSTVDFSAHPWAGAKVRMTLVARDEAGQEGRSEPVEVTLPQRTFTKPLAKALVEQRRKLVMDVDDRRKVQLAMDALMIEPEIVHEGDRHLSRHAHDQRAAAPGVGRR